MDYTNRANQIERWNRVCSFRCDNIIQFISLLCQTDLNYCCNKQQQNSSKQQYQFRLLSLRENA